jgi:hypothetical protein
LDIPIPRAKAPRMPSSEIYFVSLRAPRRRSGHALRLDNPNLIDRKRPPMSEKAPFAGAFSFPEPSLIGITSSVKPI